MILSTIKKVLSSLLGKTNSSVVKSQPIVSEELFNRIKKDIEAESKKTPTIITSSLERRILEKIRTKTNKHNLNNVTRTQAYLSFFKKNPEVHWAFLAHMVSRNGGFSMTDLQSSYMDGLLGEQEKTRYFQFLEHCNAYIFQDAYPQLLLYEESKNLNKPLFSLLPRFYVSSFMVPIWEFFFKEQSPKLITTAMIINEQQMLQKRVIDGIYQSNSILEELPFKVQESLGFTFVFFPNLRKNTRISRLFGVTVHHFDDVNERILIGKRLYQILFYDKEVHKDALAFAENTKHSGSREDYWSWLFTSNIDNNKKLYSPYLLSVWDNVKHSFLKKDDWFKSPEALDHLNFLPRVEAYDITDKVIEQISIVSSLDILTEFLLKANFE